MHFVSSVVTLNSSYTDISMRLWHFCANTASTCILLMSVFEIDSFFTKQFDRTLTSLKNMVKVIKNLSNHYSLQRKKKVCRFDFLLGKSGEGVV